MKQKNADALAEVAQNDPNYPLAVQKRLDADLEAQKRYDNELVALDQQAMTQRKAIWDAGFSALNSGMDHIVTDALTGHANISADLRKTLADMLSSWVTYFLNLEMKSVEAALFMNMQAAMSFVVPGMSSSSMPAGGAFPAGTSSIPGLAEGGPVSADNPYVVGENGPELFLPGHSGAIVPNHDLKSMTGAVTHNTAHVFNIHGVTDFDSFKSNQSQVSAQMYAALATAARRKG
jgi:hypothetical protein